MGLCPAWGTTLHPRHGPELRKVAKMTLQQGHLSERDLENPSAIRAVAESLQWWHTIDLGHGIVTRGRGGSEDRMEWIRLPPNLTGMTVLDIGAFDGLFSFEAEKRGAARVVAIDETRHETFPLARRILRSKVELVIGDLRKLSLQELGGEQFDLIFFMGVLYHMHDPMTGLVKCYDWCKPGGMVILETDSAMNWTPIPSAKFVGTAEGLRRNAPNWWLPNKPCLRAMVEAAGFRRYEFVRAPRDASTSRWRRTATKVVPRLLPGPWDGRMVMHLWK